MALADDADDVRAVVDTYIDTEVVDLKKQMSLMADDRVFINGGLRQTDNAANMRSQMAGTARARELDPDAEVIVTAEDVMIRVYGDAAVASFYRYWNVINSADAVRAGVAGGGGPPPAAVTLVLAKMGNNWKIVHTHQSNIGG